MKLIVPVCALGVTITMESSAKNMRNHPGFIQVLVAHFKRAFWRQALPKMRKIFDAHAKVA